MNVSFAVMAHPARADFVDDLLPHLPEGTPVVWDQKCDRWDTGSRSMAAYDRDSDWHVVVQDDALPCLDFAVGVHRALGQIEHYGPVSFYTGRARPHGPAVTRAVSRAMLAGKSWLEMRGPLWGPAVAVPTDMIDRMLDYCEDIAVPNYDLRMTVYFSKIGVPCWYSIPSLVNHRVGSDNPSLVPGRGASRARTAHAWIGDDSALDVDWTTGALKGAVVDDYWYSGPTGHQCTTCGEVYADIWDIVNHANRHEHLGKVDAVIGPTPGCAAELHHIIGRLDEEIQGELYLERDELPDNGRLTLVWTEDDMELTGKRPTVALDTARKLEAVAERLQGAKIRVELQ